MIQIGDIKKEEGSIISIRDAVIAPIEELTIRIPFEQYENGQIKSHSGVTVRHINTLMPHGVIECRASEPVSMPRDDGSVITFTEATLDPVKKIFHADEDYYLTEDELTRFFEIGGVRNEVFHEDFGMNVAKGSYDILSGKLRVEWKKFILDGSVLPSKQGREEKTKFYYTIDDADIPVNGVNQVSSHHTLVSALDVKAGRGKVFNVSAGMKRIVFTFPEFDTVEECADYLKEQYEAGTPVSFAWELATPVEVQLKPRRLKTYLKANTIWNSIGEVF